MEELYTIFLGENSGESDAIEQESERTQEGGFQYGRSYV